MKIRAEMGRQRAPLLPREYQVDMAGARGIVRAEPDWAAEEKPDIRLRDILPLLTGGGLTFLCHEEADRSVLAENLRELTAAGREDHAALLNARVSEIAPTPEGTEVVLTDVDPEELARFNEAYEAFMDAEQSVGPTM